MDDKQTTIKDAVKKLFQKNKILFILVFLTLVLTNAFLLLQVKSVFEPLLIILDVIAIPLIFAALFYYLFKPVRDWLELKGVNRVTAIIIVFLIIIAIISIFIFSLIPFLQDQIILFIEEFPNNWTHFVDNFNLFLDKYGIDQYHLEINETITNIATSISNNIENYVSQASSVIGSAIGRIVTVGIGLITTPILIYYMLKEGDKLKPAMLEFVPLKSRPVVASFLSDANKQLALYIRGQVLVAVGVGIMFVIGYSIIGLPYGILLALLAGVLNVIPYLGTFLSMVPAYIIAFVHSPLMVIYVTIVFTIEQTIEGRILSPKILGNNLDIHPITILVVLLVSGRLFGFLGIVIGVPIYAIAKVAVKYFYGYLKENTDLY